MSSSTSFVIDGVTFHVRTGHPRERGESKENEFVLVKTDDMLNFYERMRSALPKYIMEIGMYEGGSLVYFDKLFKPKKIVGLDVRKDPIEALEIYRKKCPHLVTYYGRYQQKEGTLMAARKEFPEGIDLVIDDASHLYGFTKETFKMLFPLVRSGGHYVIEDWSWSHKPEYQGEDSTWIDQPALTNLVFELIIIASQANSAIDSVVVERNLVCVKKAKGVFDPESFSLSKFLRGRKLNLI